MLKILIRLLIVCATLTFIVGVEAQSAVNVQYAGVQDNTLVLYQADGSSLRVDNPDNQGLTNLAWSPDGSKLAYVLIDADYNWHAMVVNADGTNVTELNTGKLEYGFPLAWTPDGQILFAQAPTSLSDTSYRVTLATIASTADAVPTPLGQVLFGVGCGGGSSLPADWQYWAETGFGGSFLTLQWTDYGVLYSVMCGGAGYALLDPATGESRYVTTVSFRFNNNPNPEDNISRAKLSPDGTLLVAIRTVYAEPDPVESVVLVDLTTGVITDVPTSMQPDQVAWSASGDIYYVARTTADPDLLDDLTPEQRARLDAMGTGFVIGSNNVTVMQVDVVSGEETFLTEGYAHYVGRMVEAFDGSLWISQIPNMDAWLQGIGDGTIDPLNDVGNLQQLATAPVSVFRLFNGEVERIADNLNQFTLRPE